MLSDIMKLGELAIKAGVIRREDIEELKDKMLEALAAISRGRLGAAIMEGAPVSYSVSEAAAELAIALRERDEAVGKLRRLTERAESAEDIVEQYRNSFKAFTASTISVSQETEGRVIAHVQSYHDMVPRG